MALTMTMTTTTRKTIAGGPLSPAGLCVIDGSRRAATYPGDDRIERKEVTEFRGTPSNLADGRKAIEDAIRHTEDEAG